MAVDVAALRILHYPAEVLRRRANPILEVDDEVRSVAARMIELMHGARGIGLAAPQVGLPWRMFVANPTGEPGDDRVFINPELAEVSRDTCTSEEGCLSLPGIRGEITRPAGVTIRALDCDGCAVELASTDLAARVWQHEADHLDGVLILDRMPPIDRRANRRAVKELEEAEP